jgi:hypothetical protein
MFNTAPAPAARAAQFRPGTQKLEPPQQREAVSFKSNQDFKDAKPTAS